MQRSPGLFALAASIFLAGCATAPPAAVEAPGLRFQPAAGWVEEETSSRFRVAQYRLPGPDGADASLVVYYFGAGAGTGFVFENYGPAALRWALDTALDYYADHEAWSRVMDNAMARDFSWQLQARRYVELYDRLVRERA